ncbi:hypothetical protein BU26DRAFT_525046 [Trematosphaeria pertusa]|uniref:GPI inositol-deacylase n=1 Tax=Trematosphaeria pertusa TaxID=390896 RepID=A0A6A6HUU3_9PLEO|nr:uncharacterized protein BU26DRAFT_525046 [Trematosphaeria pertusa]KAF2241532.1 hypothetical protein BU26DRAFT_525046 [Trematosphaeria pertusa]
MGDSAEKHGLQDLTPDGVKAIVDIVFVHGLHGNKETTWTATTKDGKVLWPRDLLPQDIKEARILTWGYDSHITHFWTKTSLGNVDTHARNLCADLSSLREYTDTTDRPIIFVAHSLGGIVCANTLVLSENSAEPYANEIASHIRGIVFLGTPHEGSSKTKWAKVGQQFVSLFKTVNKEHIQILEQNSIKLGAIGGAFETELRKRRESKEQRSKIEIVCFFEEKESPFGIIVTEDSAHLGSYETMSIAADHRGMAKFTSRADPGYTRVLGFLRRWVDSLMEEVAKAAKPESAVTNNKAWFNGPNYGGFMVGQSDAPQNLYNQYYGQGGPGLGNHGPGGLKPGN